MFRNLLDHYIQCFYLVKYDENIFCILTIYDETFITFTIYYGYLN